MSGPLTAPPYGRSTLAEVMSSAAALLGIPGFDDTLGLAAAPDLDDGGEPEAVTVLLVDGMGWWPWQGAIELTPVLAGLSARRISTTFPSTTPTALASLGTALSPGAHGLVGAAFWLPEEDAMLHPLSWGSRPQPVATQPEPTVFERVARAGVPVVRIGPGAYAQSGLTRAGLRGGAHRAVEDRDELVEAVTASARGLAYAYVSELDRTGHVNGIDSPQWQEELASVDALVRRLLEGSGPRHRILVTADHGMVDCPAESRIEIEGLPMGDAVAAVGGEPRVRHVYCRAGAAPEMGAAWAQEMGDRAWVLTREECIGAGLLGDVEADYAGRVGDLVVVARGTTSLSSRVDPLVSGLVGQHGSVSDAEMEIPLLQSTGRRHG